MSIWCSTPPSLTPRLPRPPPHTHTHINTHTPPPSTPPVIITTHHLLQNVTATLFASQFVLQRLAAKTRRGGHVWCSKQPSWQMAPVWCTHMIFTFIRDLNVCEWEFTCFFGRHLFLPFDTGWRRPERLHPSLAKLPSPPPAPSPPPPRHHPFYWYQTAAGPPHTAPLFSPSCRRTAAIQQGRSDITVSSQPILCFVYFKQHLLSGQRRTCWVFCWNLPCLRCHPQSL